MVAGGVRGVRIGASWPGWAWAVSLVCFASIWIVTHPYAGIQHDGILYAAQAMLHLRPDVFRGDIFFAWGSQDDYAVFGRVYSMLVSALGLDAASRILWALSQALWFAVALAWLRRAVTPAALPVAVAVASALPAYYGSDLIFRVAEPFLTARSFAEPLVLGGLLLWTAGRRAVSVALFCVAAALHPIMALPGIAGAILLAVLQGEPRQWLREHRAMTLAGSALVVLAGIAFIAGVGGFTRIDEDWYNLVAARGVLVTVDRWGSIDWARVMLPCAVILVAARDLEMRLRPVFVALAVCGLLGLIVALSACLARWELGVQAQFWRLAWPAVWAMPVAAIAAAARLDASQGARRIMLAASVPAIALTAQEWWAGGWVLAVAYLLLLAAFHAGVIKESAASRRLAMAFAVLLCAVALIDGVLTLYVRLAFAGRLPDLEETALALVTRKFGWFVLPSLVMAGQWLAVKLRSPQLAPAAAVACLAAALVSFDGRGPTRANFERLVETGIPVWSEAIPVDASVYWPQRLEYSWFVLGRRNYVSGGQLAGGIFSRQKTIEGKRRQDYVSAISAVEERMPRIDGSRRIEPSTLSAADLVRACADRQLDFVVLRTKLGPTAAPAFIDSAAHRPYHLHRCADYRRP